MNHYSDTPNPSQPSNEEFLAIWTTKAHMRAVENAITYRREFSFIREDGFIVSSDEIAKLIATENKLIG